MRVGWWTSLLYDPQNRYPITRANSRAVNQNTPSLPHFRSYAQAHSEPVRSPFDGSHSHALYKAGQPNWTPVSATDCSPSVEPSLPPSQNPSLPLVVARRKILLFYQLANQLASRPLSQAVTRAQSPQLALPWNPLLGRHPHLPGHPRL